MEDNSRSKQVIIYNDEEWKDPMRDQKRMMRDANKHDRKVNLNDFPVKIKHKTRIKHIKIVTQPKYTNAIIKGVVYLLSLIHI